MAAATITIGAPEDTFAQDMSGLKMRRFAFASISNTNTFASGIQGVWLWAVYSATKAILVTHSAGTFTFTVTSGPVNDAVLFVWSRDY